MLPIRDADERNVVKELIDGMLLKHQARRLSVRATAAEAGKA